MQNQLKALQILRAVAATSVVYYHIKCMPNFGSFGVDVFFVISGFVMSLIIANGENPSRFAINRIARIVPLYWLLTTAVLVLTLFYPALFDSTTANFHNYLKSLFFIPYYKESGFLHPMLTMGWSLNYEMFFYVCVWLSVIAFGNKYFFSTFFLLIGSYILLGRLIENRVMNCFFGDYMVFEFMAGMILHQFYVRGFLEKIPAAVFVISAVAAFSFMAFMETQVPDLSLDVFGPPAIIVVFSVVRLEKAIATLPKWLVDRLVEIGDASYATYLTHYYIVAAFRKVIHERYDLINPYTPFGVVVVIALSLVVGHVIYISLDRPMSRWTRRRLELVIAPRQSRRFFS